MLCVPEIRYAAQPSMTSITLHHFSETQIAELAATLAAALQPGDCLALTGDLGAGKTFFARHLIRALCGEVDVPSPTFMLVQHYQAKDGAGVAHYDLYRLKHAQEIEETGLSETLQRHINLIEWPEIASACLPADTLNIVFAFTSSLKYRDVVITGNNAWMTRLPHLLLPSR